MAIFRGDGGIGHEPVVCRVFLERVEEELRRAAHHGIDLFQIFFVAVELIAVPQVGAQPRAAARPHARIREVNGASGAPEIGVVVGDPTARAIHLLGGPRAGHGKVFHHRNEWLHAFAEVARFRRPVVHFGVDVDGVFALPRWIHAFIPQPLQVGRLGAGTRRTDQQIAAILEIQRGKLRIVAVVKIPDPFVGGQFHGLAGPQIKGHALEQPLVLLRVRSEQLVEFFLGGSGDLAFDDGFRITADILVIFVARGRRDQDRDRIRIGHRD